MKEQTPKQGMNSECAEGSIDAAYKAYFDAASENDLAEESAWAELAGIEFAKLEGTVRDRCS